MVVGDFLRWISLAPEHRRAQVAAALVRRLVAEADPVRKDALDTAATLLADDGAPAVRRALAAALAAEADAPRHLVVQLVNDLASVAEPLAQRSAVLLDAELVDLVAVGGARLQRAVAARPTLSRAVAAALAEVGSRGAVGVLLGNSGARLTAASFARLAARFAEDAAVRDALLARPDLPVTVRHTLIRRVSEALQHLVAGNEWLADDTARRLARDACDRATVSFLARTPAAELPGLIAYLREGGLLTTALMLRALCLGEIAFFEEGLAAITDVPRARVAALIADGRRSALTALLDKSGLPKRSHEAFAAAITAWRDVTAEEIEQPYRFARRMAEATLTLYQPDHAEEIDEILSLLRRIAAEAARDAVRALAGEMPEAA